MDYTKFIIFLDSENVYLNFPCFNNLTDKLRSRYSV